MCYRVVERYAVCQCVYFVHGIDQCGSYGQRGHGVEERVLLVGHTCPHHAAGYSYSAGGSGSSRTGGSGGGFSMGQEIPDAYGAGSYGSCSSSYDSFRSNSSYR